MAVGRYAGQRPRDRRSNCGAADDFLRLHENRARARGHRSAMARLGYARGRLLGAIGELSSARKAFDESLALLDGLPLRYDLARVDFAYGQTLRRAGKRREADAIIGTARELYLSLGALAYVARCERELKAGGLHLPTGSRAPRRAHPAGGGGDFACRTRFVEPGSGRRAVCVAEDRAVPPDPDLRQAGRALAFGAGGAAALT